MPPTPPRPPRPARRHLEVASHRSDPRRPRRRFTTLLASTVLALITFACAAADLAEPPPEVPEVVRYVALGDSIAAGTAAETSYVREYARWFEAETGARVAVTNRAVPGWTSGDLLAAVLEDEGLRAELADAHLVTFNIGGNDLLPALRAVREGRCGGSDGQRCVRAAVSVLTGTWEELLGELLDVTDGDTDGLRTMDLYRPRQLATVGEPAAPLEGHLDEVNDHLTRTATAAGIAVARVEETFGAPDERAGTDALLGDDGIHPNVRGHVHIADALAELGTGLNAAP